MDDTFGEIGRVFRTVGKLVREKTEDYFGNVSPVERALREVADEGCCTIPNSLLRELAKASNDIHSYHPIMQCIWQGLAQEGAAWRRTYKSLCLLEYVILFGPRRALEDCKHAMMRIKYLSGFRYHDGTREQGGGVRQKSQYIMELIEQPETLAAARQKALEDSERYVGVENKPLYSMQGLASMRGVGSLTPGFFGNSDLDQQGRSLPPAAQSWSPFFTGPTRATHGAPPDNPFATINAFQSEADARRTWNVATPTVAPVELPNFTSGYDAPPVRSLSLRGDNSQQSTSNSTSYERGVPAAMGPHSSQLAGIANKSNAAKPAVNLLSVDDESSIPGGNSSEKDEFNANDIWADTAPAPLPVNTVEQDDDFFNAQTDIFSAEPAIEKATQPLPSSNDLLSLDDEGGAQSNSKLPMAVPKQATLDDLVGL